MNSNKINNKQNRPADRLFELVEYTRNKVFNKSKIGLIDGKIGIVISLFELYSIIKERDLFNLAEDYLNNFFESKDLEYSINFKDGILGVCWSLHYLINNGYTNNPEIEDLLYEIDLFLIKKRQEYLNQQTNDFLGLGLYYVNKYLKYDSLAYDQDTIQSDFKSILEYIKREIIYKNYLTISYNYFNPDEFASVLYFILKMREHNLFYKETDQITRYIKTNIMLLTEFEIPIAKQEIIDQQLIKLDNNIHRIWDSCRSKSSNKLISAYYKNGAFDKLIQISYDFSLAKLLYGLDIEDNTVFIKTISICKNLVENTNSWQTLIRRYPVEVLMVMKYLM